jgi:hypothetical protein
VFDLRASSRRCHGGGSGLGCVTQAAPRALLSRAHSRASIKSMVMNIKTTAAIVTIIIVIVRGTLSGDLKQLATRVPDTRTA